MKYASLILEKHRFIQDGYSPLPTQNFTCTHSLKPTPLSATTHKISSWLVPCLHRISIHRSSLRRRTYLCFFSACAAVFFCSSFRPSSLWSLCVCRSAATASSLSLASLDKGRLAKVLFWEGIFYPHCPYSGFQWPFPSLDFASESCLCFSLFAACSGSSVPHQLPLISSIWPPSMLSPLYPRYMFPPG